MARTLNNLSVPYVRSPKIKPGRHSDGGGLYLNVGPTGGKSWVFMFVREGKRRELGLGSYPAVSIADARQLAANARSLVEQGLDPRAARASSQSKTFGDCADDYIKNQADGWRNAKHRDQWEMTLGDRYCRKLRKLPVNEVTTEDVLAVLRPIWLTKAETASRLRGRIERVLSYAKVKKLRTGDNPAAWRGHLSEELPMRKKLQRGHHAALPWKQVPSFVRLLRDTGGMSALALEFLIFCAARSGEVMGAKWSEFDLKGATWAIPAARMKAGKEHRVPLTDRALEIVLELHEIREGDFVFPGARKGKGLSIMAFTMTMRRLKFSHATPHGFRSAFRDWAGDKTEHPREIAEAALAHTVGNAVEQAYRRGDAFEKRRKLMDDWAAFLETRPKEKPADTPLVEERDAA